MQLAIFDIDGTLVSGSSERMFWFYLRRHGRLRAPQLAAFAAFAIRHARAGRDVMRKNKAYLAGLQTTDVMQLAADFVAAELAQHLFKPAVVRLRRHLERGDVVVLQSGTLDAIAWPLAASLGVRHVCATRCRERHGVYLAEPPVRHPFAAEKLSYARELARTLGLDLAAATAYCDSHYDLPLLDAVQHAVAVQPDRRLHAVARARGWELLASSSQSAAADTSIVPRTTSRDSS